MNTHKQQKHTKSYSRNSSGRPGSREGKTLSNKFLRKGNSPQQSKSPARERIQNTITELQDATAELKAEVEELKERAGSLKDDTTELNEKVEELRVQCEQRKKELSDRLDAICRKTVHDMILSFVYADVS